MRKFELEAYHDDRQEINDLPYSAASCHCLYQCFLLMTIVYICVLVLCSAIVT